MNSDFYKEDAPRSAVPGSDPLEIAGKPTLPRQAEQILLGRPYRRRYDRRVRVASYDTWLGDGSPKSISQAAPSKSPKMMCRAFRGVCYIPIYGMWRLAARQGTA